ncbi:hypothetical protein EVB32_043 [Rhizobium phage RHph_TM39]|uniref:Uncharacterized protein n=1 Tax=Rhizobium phage RHph_TM30 TaxID=2509764 RepID=A0A7S5R4Y8_9CAUD|nr:hypothetical protein PQC16_gp043 [Rhizobium phage RHph_TM30]QIG71514.1 hypothetical protein EVB94_043 [Rhizobium phage RHph_TM40]QIG71877.1 hypothetical protein EVB95_043 [Rhizobium phage RHph_TM2_3B]QIG72239.1 hypothetical protein EVB96_043 [Rhizobium phage RHph_TM3_3_6]QIG77031.1 hypothetical protein EVB32_043 [Rhizobium phage RHph_TM39]QIG77371.1 hypothetical protein EVB61_043 [Rhizobium phage RHph_TM21B]QIG77630.1 hypothetical protein EVB64_043 [Rhizobium phage RHph_TM61]
MDSKKFHGFDEYCDTIADDIKSQEDRRVLSELYINRDDPEYLKDPIGYAVKTFWRSLDNTPSKGNS